MLYDYRCLQCGKEVEEFNRISERRTNAPVCCGERMDLFMSAAPYGWVDREIRYVCPVTNQGITSRYQRNETMKRNDLMDANDFVNHKTIAKSVQKKQELDAFVEANKPPPEIQEKVNRYVQSTL